MSIIAAESYRLISGQKLMIRSALANDAEALVRIFSDVVEEDCYTIITSSELQLTKAYELRRIQLFADHPLKVYLVAEIAGEVVAMASVYAGAQKRTEHVASFSLFVDQAFRGLGVGKQLLHCVLRWSQGRFEKLTLMVYPQNTAAVQLYRQMGFDVEYSIEKAVKLADGQYKNLQSMVYWL